MEKQENSYTKQGRFDEIYYIQNVLVLLLKGEKMRIIEHPVLGNLKKQQKITFTFDGKVMNGLEGEPIAVALKENGVMIHRYTTKQHKPRGIFCAIGRCTDCVMVVNGQPNTRTCITPLKSGMDVKTQYGISEKEGTKNEIL